MIWIIYWGLYFLWIWILVWVVSNIDLDKPGWVGIALLLVKAIVFLWTVLLGAYTLFQMFTEWGIL